MTVDPLCKVGLRELLHSLIIIAGKLSAMVIQRHIRDQTVLFSQ